MSAILCWWGEGPAKSAWGESGIPCASWDEIVSVTTDDGVASRHIDAVLAIPYVDAQAIRARKFKVALDCVRGAGATIMPALLHRLGCAGVPINLEPDGRVSGEPDPVPADLAELEQLA